MTASARRQQSDRSGTDSLLLGIQGGRGSYNEQAALHRMAELEGPSHQVVYLHTTERVLRALHDGAVDRGQFAIHNSIGGMVAESVTAMARFRFTVVAEFTLAISHALMVVRDADLATVDTVMTHPQVLAQCRTALSSRYPRLRHTSGHGDLIDQARVAELLGSGALPATVATVGSGVLADLHGLRVVEDRLQDAGDNVTRFLWVEP